MLQRGNVCTDVRNYWSALYNSFNVSKCIRRYFIALEQKKWINTSENVNTD